MDRYDRVLLPTDGSAGFERVVDRAVATARAHGASIHGLYVVDATAFAGLPTETAWDGVRDVLREESKAALDQVRRRVPDGVPVETSTVEGTPSREIVRYAEAHPVDCVVMGTHGRGGIDRLLLGSVAERVVRTSPVPVVTVGLREADGPDETAGREPAASGR